MLNIRRWHSYAGPPSKGGNQQQPCVVCSSSGASCDPRGPLQHLQPRKSLESTSSASSTSLQPMAAGSSRVTSLSPATGAPPFSEVVIALGCNEGNRVQNLLQALQQLPQYGVELLRVSLLYESAPAYVSDQPAFLNAALVGRTDLPPLQLLYNLKLIEKAAGRDFAGQRWGPRVLDLDIVFYGSNNVEHECLQVPHVRWQERPFVLAPIADLLLPSDVQQGFLHEPTDTASVLGRLQQAVAQWDATGGESQVGAAGLCRVLPVHRQIWELGHTTHIMGILNITPDSFSDGGHHQSVAAAVEAARRMRREGASVIDVGGQSTRPGAPPVSPEVEAARVTPVIRALRDDSELVHVPVSIDTFYASVAEAAVEAGADMVNDVSGGTQDPAMLPTVAKLGVPYVVMHMRGTPQTMNQPAHCRYECVWKEVGHELHQAARRAVAAGILPWNLILDPGLGFAKTQEDSTLLLGQLRALREHTLPGVYGRMPLLVGASRKGFLGRLSGRSHAVERDLATAASSVAAVSQGAEIVRVHNVAMNAEALRVADGVFRGVFPATGE